ncbi:esterase B1-like [Sitodiplosis mosellana]|uniref:esterase B1-like n=1 Tax=Sitodiplosis mosellana TaxID=263140 RepID=UPI0024437878|nr:esterase B1-like [Sitodiplosis mosellana]XP_055320706.1 esterase B1-like [Sitodiplosis mosellana]XP_055320707.1 esterase B1-like [Sitodiplosis mosellana]
MTSIKLTDLFSFAWSYTNSRVVDYYRHYFSEVCTVTTKSGPVKGFKIASAFDYRYINFIGIPYAKPPVGELRFKDPQPFEPSTEIINQQFGRGGSLACQADLISQRSIGNENCLHLSVYTRDIKPQTLKPVMVWIHGGAFILGSNSKDFYNPEFLLRKDVVLIAVNYRLGAFGFSSFKDPELGIPGNAGLKDQTMALKWVKENCMHFGGDPKNITIFGESAGSASVSLHLISDMSKGLFHKAILMSGTAYAPWALSPVKDWTQRIAKKLGWNGEGGEKACANVLQRASHDAIIKVQESTLTLEDRKKYILCPFGPVVEPYESAQCFLKKDPKELAQIAWSKDVPMIMGTCSEEGLLFYKMTMKKPSLLQKLKLEYTLPFHELDVDFDSDQAREMGKQLKKFYFGYSAISVETIFVYLMILNDKLFAHPTHRLILARTKSQSAPTYLLRFNFDSTYSLTKKIFAGRNIPGVCHADDCSYYFRSVFAGSDPACNSTEWKTMERMTETFTTFARTGDPNNETIAPIQWKPVSLDASDKNVNKYKCLNISTDVSYIDWPELDRMQYWDHIYKKFNRSVV